MTRRFRISFEVYADLDLDDAVIDVVDDEWREHLYNLRTPEQIAEHIAGNLLTGARLSILDGWADQPDSHAQLTDEDWHITAEEMKE